MTLGSSESSGTSEGIVSDQSIGTKFRRALLDVDQEPIGPGVNIRRVSSGENFSIRRIEPMRTGKKSVLICRNGQKHATEYISFAEAASEFRLAGNRGKRIAEILDGLK